MIEKNASTRFSQDPEVGVKCRVTRGWRSSQARTTGCLWGDRLSTTTCSSRRGEGGATRRGEARNSWGGGRAGEAPVALPGAPPSAANNVGGPGRGEAKLAAPGEP